ncbi:hypothetical protein F4782DRAFT_515862 [Xylaria castorea]|nr:hypothetical protein F4782DRAFT_515862 [Xylaria castorea]
MCYQVVEVYSACRCLYYQHAVSRCASYGRQGHSISKRTIPVGAYDFACSEHSQDTAQNTAALEPEYPRLNPNKIAQRVVKSSPALAKDNDSENTQYGPNSSASSTDSVNIFRPSLETRSQTDRLHTNNTKIAKAEGVLSHHSDSNDSNYSINNRRIVSQALTATTADENALEALFRGLLKQNGLCNLWPQIIARPLSRSHARQTIDRFLQRFAEDLECLATKSNDAENEELRRIVLSSSRFVKRYRAEIASRICQAYETPHGSLNADTNTTDITRILTIEDAPDTDCDPFTFSVAEKLIFTTEPILYLEANVCAFIRQQQQKQFSRLAIHLRSFASLTAQVFRQAPIQAGKRRLNWTCICGCQVIDDYESESEGAIEAFEGRLKQYNQATQSVQGDNQYLRKGAIPATIKWFRKSFAKAKSPGLPSHQQGDNSPSTQLGSCVRSAGTSQADHNFVLLCVPYLRWGLRLHNSEVCKINSDQQFFKLLQQCYFTQRRGATRELLRIFTKVRALQFVKFEVFRNKLVDVRVCPSLPTASNDYIYDPMPPDVIPPIGPNLLMHLFENPDHADVTLFLYKRFPKKLRAQLEACSTKGSSIGWGVEFVEGVDWYAVFVSGLLGFLFCLLFAVAWSAARGDVQGGFGIASFLLTFFIFCGGILHYMI